MFPVGQIPQAPSDEAILELCSLAQTWTIGPYSGWVQSVVAMHSVISFLFPITTRGIGYNGSSDFVGANI